MRLYGGRARRGGQRLCPLAPPPAAAHGLSVHLVDPANGIVRVQWTDPPGVTISRVFDPYSLLGRPSVLSYDLAARARRLQHRQVRCSRPTAPAAVRHSMWTFNWRTADGVCASGSAMCSTGPARGRRCRRPSRARARRQPDRCLHRELAACRGKPGIIRRRLAGRHCPHRSVGVDVRRRHEREPSEPAAHLRHGRDLHRDAHRHRCERQHGHHPPERRCDLPATPSRRVPGPVRGDRRR